MEDLKKKLTWIDNGFSELKFRKDLGNYFQKARNEYIMLLSSYDIEEENDIELLNADDLVDFETSLDKIIEKYHIPLVSTEEPIEEGTKDERELLMDKKSSRAYQEIFDIISRFYTDKKNTHLSLRGATIHFEKHNPNTGEWNEEQQLALAKKQWSENGLIQSWASSKCQDPFRLDLLDLRSDHIGIKVDALVLLNNFLEEECTTGDMAVASGRTGLDAMQRRGSKELESANSLEREGKILKESEGGAFAYFYKVGENWWKNWVNENAKQYDIVYDKEDRLYLVYEGNTHVMTYNTKTGEIFSDQQLNELTTQVSTLVEKIEKITGKKIILL